MTKSEIQNLRREYTLEALNATEVNPDPFLQFRHWFGEALTANLAEPNAMTLATVDEDGKPSCRVVLLKEADFGFVFYTNYLSRKGRAIDANPNACINFFWLELERQIRIEGQISKVSAEESDEYFNSRPYGSRLGAIASPQSKRITDRTVLESNLKEAQESFSEEKIKRPEFWGGFRLLPTYFEFWQGRPNRLHDRICYEKGEIGWKIFRIAP